MKCEELAEKEQQLWERLREEQIQRQELRRLILEEEREKAEDQLASKERDFQECRRLRVAMERAIHVGDQLQSLCVAFYKS